MTKVVFELYLTGRTGQSQRALANLKAICEERLAGHHEIRVIDVLEQPQAAEERKILATPTLIRVSPPPLRRVIGDLSDLRAVIGAIGLPEGSAAPEDEESGP